MAETKYSKADLRRKILEDLTIVDVGGAIAAEYQAKIDPEIQRTLEYLEDERLLIFNAQAEVSAEVIPARIMQALAEICAYNVMHVFGIPRDINVLNSGMRALRRSVLTNQSSEPVKAIYY